MRADRLPAAITLAVVMARALSVPAEQPPRALAPPPIFPNSARLDQTLGGLDGPGFAIAYSEKQGILAAGCEAGTIHYWNKGIVAGIRGGDSTPNVLKGHRGPVTALAWSEGAVLASTGADQEILLWSMPDGKMAHTLKAPAVVRALTMSPDGRLLASAGEDAAVQLWDVASGKPGTKFTGHTDWVLCLTFSPDGAQLASGGCDGTIRLWNVTSSKKLLDIAVKPAAPPNTPPLPNNFILALAFSPDGKQLAAGGADAQIHLFSVADGKLVRSLAGHTGSVTALAYHPSGAVLASASKDRTVRLWSPSTGQSLTPKPLEGHTAWVQGLAFVSRATRVASAGADGTVRLWDLTQK